MFDWPQKKGAFLFMCVYVLGWVGVNGDEVVRHSAMRSWQWTFFTLNVILKEMNSNSVYPSSAFFSQCCDILLWK
jgi:hypothetical protein